MRLAQRRVEEAANLRSIRALAQQPGNSVQQIGVRQLLGFRNGVES